MSIDGAQYPDSSLKSSLRDFARDLCYILGKDGWTLEDLSTVSDISHPTVLRLFESKEKLLEEIKKLPPGNSPDNDDKRRLKL